MGVQRELDVLLQQKVVFQMQEKEKTGAVLNAKKLIEILQMQQRALVLEAQSLAKIVATLRDQVKRGGENEKTERHDTAQENTERGRTHK
jgi:hypothetical protein